MRVLVLQIILLITALIPSAYLIYESKKYTSFNTLYGVLILLISHYSLILLLGMGD